MRQAFGDPEFLFQVPGWERRLRCRHEPLPGNPASPVRLAFSGIYLFPLLWIFLTSIKPDALTFVLPPVWVFKPTISHYVKVFYQAGFGHFLLNSIIIVFFSTLLSLVIGTLAGYSFSRFKAGGMLLPSFILFTRMVPPIVIAIPLFVIVRNLNLLDTHISLIIAYLAFNVPLTMWLMKSYLDGIPKEFDEAALVDGASTMRILLSVILPLAKPGLMATGILNFIFIWNEFLFGLIFTVFRAKTVVAAADFVTERGILWGQLGAVGVTIIMPLVIVVFVFRKSLVRGLTSELK